MAPHFTGHWYGFGRSDASTGNGGGGSNDYWIATLGGTSDEYFFTGLVDNSGNSYFAGYTTSAGAGSADLLLAKYNSSGVIQWQKTLGGTSGELQSSGKMISFDSSNNIYTLGRTNSTGAGNYDALIVKYNSSGVIQWQKTLGGTGGDNDGSITLDSSDNFYVTGNTNSTGAGGYDAFIVKYNSSGVIQWQKTLGGTGAEYSRSIQVDNSGNVYIVGSTQFEGLIAKYNSSGVIQWQKTFGGTGNQFFVDSILDSSGNIYVVGYGQIVSGNDRAFIVKYNSSGVIQWQRSLSSAGVNRFLGVTVDSSGDVYAVGTSNPTGIPPILILVAKYNSSGVIQWQRTLSSSDSTSIDAAFTVNLDGLGSMYISGYHSISYTYDAFVARLPDDGSLTGTYGIWNYASSSLTDAAMNLTDATSSLTDSTSSLTDASSSLTDATSNLTSSITTL